MIEKATLDRIPLPDFNKLEPYQRHEIVNLIDGLHSGEVSRADVDEWVTRLYGLGARDLQVISDTLEYNLPFAANRRNAQAVPTSAEKERFCEVLSKELIPWCEQSSLALAVNQIPTPPISPWQGIAVRISVRGTTETVESRDWEGLLRVADEAAASEILIRNGSDGLLIGRLAQRRYWSETQARLLAQRIIWSHIDLLKGHANV